MDENSSFDWEWINGTENFAECLNLRTKVFVDEQKFAEELDDIDKYARHLLLKKQGVPVGTARIFQQDGHWVIGRICVDRTFRGQGIGNLLIELCEQEISRSGGNSAVLHAQTRVSEFYEKAGYRQCGEEYLDEYCPHIPMKKYLKEA